MLTEPRFLFLLTPPYSGSTALAKLLNTSPRSMILEPRAEGQTLVPALLKERWNPEKSVDWPHVKSVWLKQFHEVNSLVDTLRVVIEKSPPNLLRAADLQRHFPTAAFVSFIRDPYAQCSSILHRNRQPENLSLNERDAWVLKFARRWLFRAQYIRRNVEAGILHFGYEQFCAQPGLYLSKILDLCPELERLDADAVIFVKDYPAQNITNQNARQIQRLTPRDRRIITEEMTGAGEMLDFFGYTLLPE